MSNPSLNGRTRLPSLCVPRDGHRFGGDAVVAGACKQLDIERESFGDQGAEQRIRRPTPRTL